MTRFGAYSTASDVSVPFTIASGPPVAGTHVLHEIYIDDSGTMWFCVTAGTPGTWAAVAGTVIAYAEITSPQTFTTQDDVAGLSIVVPSGLGRPVWLHADGLGSNDTNGGGCVGLITDSANDAQRTFRVKSTVANDVWPLNGWKRLAAGTGGTYKMRAQRIGATGTARVYADADDVYFLRAVMG